MGCCRWFVQEGIAEKLTFERRCWRKQQCQSSGRAAQTEERARTHSLRETRKLGTTEQQHKTVWLEHNEGEAMKDKDEKKSQTTHIKLCEGR